MPSNNSKYTPEIRQRTVNHILESGKSATRVAEEMGIYTNTVCKRSLLYLEKEIHPLS